MSGRPALPAWWRSRTVRERWLLGSATALAVLIGGYYLVYAPGSAAVASANDRMRRAAAELAEVRAAAAEVEALRARATGMSEGVMIERIGALASADGLQVLDLASDEAGVRLRVRAPSTGRALALARELAASTPLSVDAMAIERESPTALLVTLTLARPTA
jgi:type II secretory pathway component PulM